MLIVHTVFALCADGSQI